MKNIRIGNDIIIVWALYDVLGNPYQLKKEFKLSLKCGNYSLDITDYTVEDNKVTFMFYGKDQTVTGVYTLTLIENDDEVGMHTVDCCKVFRMVNTSCESNDYNAINPEVESLDLHSKIDCFPPVTIDKELSGTSENPVQNKVITSKITIIDENITSINDDINNINNNVTQLDTELNKTVVGLYWRQWENTVDLKIKKNNGSEATQSLPKATTTHAGVMTGEDKKALDAVNSIINIGEYQNIQAVWDACKQIALNNPEVSIIKYSVKQGRTYNSGIVFQMYHYNDAIVTQYYLYGGGQKHECNVRHIVSDGTTDNWQPIQMFTSYKFENGTLYGYKYGKSESEQNKVAIVDIPNIGAGEYFVPTSGEYNIDGNTYRTIRFGNLPPPGAIVNINTTSYEIITLYVPTAPYALTVNVNGDKINDLPSSRAGVYYIFTASKKVIALDTL